MHTIKKTIITIVSMIMMNCAFAQNHLESTGNKVTPFYVGSGLDLSYNIVNLDDKGYGRDIYSYKQLGYGVDTYFGYDISKKSKYPLAIELEYTYRDETTNEQTHYESTFFPSVGRKFHVFSQSLMANILYKRLSFCFYVISTDVCYQFIIFIFNS